MVLVSSEKRHHFLFWSFEGGMSSVEIELGRWDLNKLDKEYSLSCWWILFKLCQLFDSSADILTVHEVPVFSPQHIQGTQNIC